MGTYAEYSLLTLPVGSSHMPLDLPSERRPVDSNLPHPRKKQGRSCLHKSIILLTIISIFLSLTVCILVIKIKQLLDGINEARRQSNVTQQEKCIPPPIRNELCTDFPKSNLNGSKYNQTECKLCPAGWHLFQDNCYLFSSSQKLETWNDSRKICIEMNSHLLTLKYEEQKIFIQNQTDKTMEYWIGYRFEMNTKKWVWENCKSCLDIRNISKQHLTENQCMVRNQHSFYPDNCNVLNSWICQKKALFI